MINETTIKFGQIMCSEACKEGKEYQPEKLKAAIPLARNILVLNKRSTECIRDLVISLQIRLLSGGSVPKSRMLRVDDRGARVEIINKDDELIKVKLEDCPHELRAYMLNNYMNNKTGHTPMYPSGQRLFYKYKKEGWLEPDAPEEKEVSDDIS